MQKALKIGGIVLGAAMLAAGVVSMLALAGLVCELDEADAEISEAIRRSGKRGGFTEIVPPYPA